MNGTTTNEKRGLRPDEHIKLLHFALNKLSVTAPRLILSPATQPRRAAVAIVIHIVPPRTYVLPPPEQYEAPQTLDALFAMDWVNQPGSVAEVLYIRRRAPVGPTHNPTSAALSEQQHVAFPGGRMDVGDEGERYTAMRTTWEELGIDLAERDWISVGQMDDREITTSLGKRLLMILSPFVFIRASPYPFAPIPPEVLADPADPNPPLPIPPPIIYSIPIPYLLSPTSPWSHVTIDISSRLAPLPRSGLLSRVLGGKKKKRRNISGESSPTGPAEEEPAVLAAKGGLSFWLWALRASVGFAFRTFVGDMKFSAMILQGRVLPYGNEEELPAKYAIPLQSEQEQLKLWGLTLGMTLDLLSGMQPHLYQPSMVSAGAPNITDSEVTDAVQSHKENILDHTLSSVSMISGRTTSQPMFTEWSGSSFTPMAGSTPTPLRSRATSMNGEGNRKRTMSGSGKFTSDGQWVPTLPPSSRVPGKELVKQLEELKDLEGADVWTPSMTSVFPRFSIPDVNFWIWVFGKRYRDVVRGWEISVRMGGSNDRRINWSGQALAAFYGAVRKALVVVIVARIVGILVALGLWGLLRVVLMSAVSHAAVNCRTKDTKPYLLPLEDLRTIHHASNEVTLCDLYPYSAKKIYDATVRKGFQGTRDEWFTQRARTNCKHGGPFETIRLDKALEADQFFHFGGAQNRRPYKISRMVLLNGKNIGTLRIPNPLKWGEEGWLCPYFDPLTRSLRFRRRSGQDVPFAMELCTLAQAEMYRPFLILAHAEGLLDNVPDAALSSLDLQTILNSGYYSRITVHARKDRPYPSIFSGYYLQSTPRLTIAPVRVYLKIPKETLYARSFPYIDDNRRLRLWNVDKGEPFELVGRGYVDGAVPPEVVRKRFPALFTWAQQLGYWKGMQ